MDSGTCRCVAVFDILCGDSRDSAVHVHDVLIGADFEFAGVQTGNVFVLPFFLSLVVLPFVVWIDVKRVNRIHDSSYKWWAWVIASFIPLIGWLPALTWLVRRRSTVQNEASESPDKALSAD